jgi:hypothetical protein
VHSQRHIAPGKVVTYLIRLRQIDRGTLAVRVTRFAARQILIGIHRVNLVAGGWKCSLSFGAHTRPRERPRCEENAQWIGCKIRDVNQNSKEVLASESIAGTVRSSERREKLVRSLSTVPRRKASQAGRAELDWTRPAFLRRTTIVPDRHPHPVGELVPTLPILPDPPISDPSRFPAPA